ncbi:helix-turn-helix transcriptional regulator [Miniphocaeibacter massiliensis]|uniref:helix-turn-helix transcriptional regulator n=1 Tax=Miniphocaeibacter massiliensis TaxID=2041841 RepID=UPI000C1C6E70|nr:PAS domain-containing protein [Miniphocaeibacter massiliensis]
MIKDIMLYYTELVEFLGETLGPDYEIVLFDLRNSRKKIIAISNGKISGRNIGDPITDFISEKLETKDYVNSNYRANYRGIVNGNKFIRCSTKYIKDSENNLIGLLCINFNDSRFEKIASDILKLCHPDALVDNVIFEKADPTIFEEPEQIGLTITDLAKKLVEDVINKIDKPIESLNKKEKMSVVSTLNSKDLFELKSSIPLVAKKLNISEATLYRYITNINKEG